MTSTQESPSSGLRPIRGSNFEDDEYMKLCRIWLNISQSSINGTDQKHNQFWTCLLFKLDMPMKACQIQKN